MTKYNSKSDIYIEPDDVIPFAQFCLNYWPYKTGSKIHEYINYQFHNSESCLTHDMIAIRHLRHLIYQPTAQPTYLLCLENAKKIKIFRTN